MGPDPPRKSLCRALFSLPPLLDVTARCSSSAACPARGTAVSLSLATCFSPWRPGRTTTRGVCEGQGQGAGGRGEDHLCGAPLGFPLPLEHEATHLQTCSRRWEGRGHGDTVLAMQYTPSCR